MSPVRSFILCPGDPSLLTLLGPRGVRVIPPVSWGLRRGVFLDSSSCEHSFWNLHPSSTLPTLTPTCYSSRFGRSESGTGVYDQVRDSETEVSFRCGPTSETVRVRSLTYVLSSSPVIGEIQDRTPLKTPVTVGSEVDDSLLVGSEADDSLLEQ